MGRIVTPQCYCELWPSAQTLLAIFSLPLSVGLNGMLVTILSLKTVSQNPPSNHQQRASCLAHSRYSISVLNRLIGPQPLPHTCQVGSHSAQTLLIYSCPPHPPHPFKGKSPSPKSFLFLMPVPPPLYLIVLKMQPSIYRVQAL